MVRREAGGDGMTGLSPTQRTLRALREQGRIAAVVEKWNQYAGEHGKREDLFGIIDVLALDPVRGVIGVQACAGSGFSAHLKKLTIEKSIETINWLSTPGTKLEIWAWRKTKLTRGGKAMRWSARILEITLEMVK
jgi:hypothetical protein